MFFFCAQEFETWLYRNPQIMDNVFGWQCPSPEGKRKCQSDDQTTSNLPSTLLSLIYQLEGAMSHS